MIQSNEKTVGDRLATFIEHTGLNKAQFAKRADMDYAHLFRILKGEAEPGIDSIRKITEAFPELSLNWLIGNVRDMLNPSAKDYDALRNINLWNMSKIFSAASVIELFQREFAEWKMLKTKMMSLEIHDESFKQTLFGILGMMQHERRNLVITFSRIRQSDEGMLSKDVVPEGVEIDDAEQIHIQTLETQIERFIDFEKNSLSQQLHNQFLEKQNGNTY